MELKITKVNGESLTVELANELEGFFDQKVKALRVNIYTLVETVLTLLIELLIFRYCDRILKSPP